MLNLYSLKYFFDSCRLGSMSKAAELNRVSRSAVSHAIKKLEEELGVELLHHKRRGFEPTRHGLSLVAEAADIFSQLENLSWKVTDPAAPLRGTLVIGSARTLATFKLQTAIAEFRRLHPQVDLKVQIHNSQELVRKLLNREIDVAFFIGDETAAGFDQVVVDSGYFCLVRPKSKTRPTEYAITEIRPETERLKQLFERRFGSPLPVYAEIPSWDSIWNWIQQGYCGGLIPDFLLNERDKGGTKCEIVIDRVQPYEIKLMFPKTRKPDPFIKSLKDVLLPR